MSEISSLGKVFEYFEKICSVPRGSGNTAEIRGLLASFARERGLACRQDGAGNIVITKEASRGYEDAPGYIIQGHMDMVCAKEDGCGKDMAAEGVEPVLSDGWIKACGTSLGADDGIALAVGMALLSDDALSHPKLEFVATADEETGMDGAEGLDMSLLSGSRLLNLDSEEDGVFTVCCAGGVAAECFFPAAREPLPGGGEVFSARVFGLLGGHSGTDIDKERGNANRLLARFLYAAMRACPDMRLISMRGGEFHNVICPDAQASVWVGRDSADAFLAEAERFRGIYAQEFAVSDPGIALSAERAEEASGAEEAFSAADTHRMLSALLALPEGVQNMSPDFPGLVQTSLNTGILGTEDDGLRFSMYIRSAFGPQKDLVFEKVAAIVRAFGGSAGAEGDYPAWTYRRESAFRELAAKVYEDITGEAPRIAGTHGGLECGLFLGKRPDLDIISIGPEMRDIHSCRERVNVASVEKLFIFVRELLKRSK